MKKTIWCLSFLIIFSLSAFASTKQECFPIKTITRGYNNKVVAVARGASFRIELPSNPTTGYDWQIEKIDKKHCYVLTSGFIPASNKNLVGAGGLKWWEIKAVKKGITKIKIRYVRPWEKDKKPAETFEIKLSIK